MSRLIPLLLLVVFAAVACSDSDAAHPGADPEQVDSTETPEKGVCRDLQPADLDRTTNATRTVPCSDPHNAETYASGKLPEGFDDSQLSDPDLTGWAYSECDRKLRKHLGTNQSITMRSMLAPVWFFPSKRAWSEGARWFRCDVVGGGIAGVEFVDLPTSTKDLFKGRIDDRWMICARGDSVNDTKVACSERHQWRAVTTIKVGEPDDQYPGSSEVAQKTKKFCDGSVKAWMGYPDDFAYASTWFDENEWDAGNRLSVCWAKTSS